MQEAEASQSTQETPQLTGRQRSLANLKPFSSTHQPKNRRSRKGIPNRKTVLNFYLKEADKRDRRERKLRTRLRLLRAQVRRIEKKLHENGLWPGP